MPWAKVLAFPGMLWPKCSLIFSGHVPPLRPFQAWHGSQDCQLNHSTKYSIFRMEGSMDGSRKLSASDRSEPLHLATPWHSSHLDLANPHHRHSSLPLTPPLHGMMKLRVVCFSILKLSEIFEHSKLPPSLLHLRNLKAKAASGQLPFLHDGFSQHGPQRSVRLPAVGSAVQICFSRSLVGLYHSPVRRHRSRCHLLSQGSQYSLTVWSFYIKKHLLGAPL